MLYAREGIHGSSASGVSPSHRVLCLQTWPELTHIPQDMVLDAARLCALLSIRPSGAPLLSILLNLPLSRVHELIQVLGLAGTAEESPSAPLQPPVAERQEPPQATEATSLLGRLWNRLSTRAA